MMSLKSDRLELGFSIHVHTIGNHFAKYERPPVKKKKDEFAFRALGKILSIACS